jgi:succinate-acetate transporter protein
MSLVGFAFAILLMYIFDFNHEHISSFFLGALFVVGIVQVIAGEFCQL